MTDKNSRKNPKTTEGRDGEGTGGSKSATLKRIARFRLSTVFDVSQTEGRELPSLGADELQGDMERFESIMETTRKTSRYPIEFENIDGGAKGYFSHSEPKRIVIQEGMPQAQTVKTAVPLAPQLADGEGPPPCKALRRRPARA